MEAFKLCLGALSLGQTAVRSPRKENCLEPTHCFLTERRSANGWDCCVSIDIVSICFNCSIAVRFVHS